VVATRKTCRTRTVKHLVGHMTPADCMHVHNALSTSTEMTQHHREFSIIHRKIQYNKQITARRGANWEGNVWMNCPGEYLGKLSDEGMFGRDDRG